MRSRKVPLCQPLPAVICGAGGGPVTKRYRISPTGESVPGDADEACPVSFVVPAFQAMGTLPDTVASIRAAAPAGSEVVIVDDGSLDGTPALAAQLADVVVLRPCQGGAARSRNDGARVARGRLLLFVDADVTVTPEAVSGLLHHLDNGADAAFGAYEPLPPPGIRNAATTYKNLLHHYTHLQAAGDAETFWSGFGGVRRDAFRAVNGFDPAVSTGADVEDIHLGYRLRAAGFRIVLDPSLQVCHHKKYTVKGVVVSDVVHRAIPWTRAMLQLRTFHADLNLRRGAMLSAASSWLGVAGLASAPLLGQRAAAAGIGGLVVFGVLNRGFLTYAARVWGGAGALSSSGFLLLYSLYGPIGAGLGATAHALRSRQDAQLNWLRFDIDRDGDRGDTRSTDDDHSGRSTSTGTEIAVTVGLIASRGEALLALDTLPPPMSWWELVVVSVDEQPSAPEWATVIRVDSSQPTRDQMRQRALDIARGEMLCVLDAGCRPEPGWLDRVREASARGDLALGGSFAQDRRSARQRAEQVARYWSWRPERRTAWVTHHPSTNLAVRTEIARALGGFQDSGALILRLAGFGARPIRFDPEMRVELTGPAPARGFIAGVGGTSRLRAAASSRYFRMGRGSRLFFAALTPISAAVDLVGTLRAAVREGTADATFWEAVPLVMAARASHWAGRALGLLWPAHRGGLVPTTAEDLPSLSSQQARSTTTGA